MIIALPTNAEHLAAALVSDCAFREVHVDARLRERALAIDPFVEAGVVLANMGRSPRLSSRLEVHGGDWDRAMARTPEIRRLIDALRTEFDEHVHVDGDAVIV